MDKAQQTITLFDRIELLEPIDAAPAGAQGTVVGFINDGSIAEVEISSPDLNGLDQIVYAQLSQLRRAS